MASTLLPLFWKQSQFLDQQIGWLAAGFSTTAILARLGLGRALERWGRKPFLLLGAALLTLPAGIYFLAGTEYWIWAMFRIIQGAGLGCYIPSILTWVADRSPAHKIGQLQGSFGVSGLLGSAFGPWLAERVYKQHGFQHMFEVLLGAGVLCFLLMSLLPESKREENSEHAIKSDRLKLRDHRAMLLVTIPFGWLGGTIVTFIAPFLDSVHLPRVGLYFAGFATASVCVRVFAGSSLDKVETGRLVFWSGGLLGLSGLTLAMLAETATIPILVGAAILNGLGHGFLFPTLSAHTVKTTPLDQRGAGLSLFTGTFDLGILSGALASGYISQNFGYSNAFLLGSILLLTSLPLFIRLNRKSKT